MLDHVTLGISDIERSCAFYDRALAPLGIERLYAVGTDATGYGIRPKAFFWIGLKETPQTGSHVAFAAADRNIVDRFYDEGLRPDYHENYYGAFVLDPDGHNIEAVCHAPQD
jgi:catechol 2,3-dioxygenase-like lactoylglutathione lyase family enzyme